MFTDMGLTQTFSRPRTPNDNPFIESFFSSTKRTRMYPGWFCSQEEGPVTEYFGWYFPWYNTEHYHSRIGYVTPEQQHQGLASGIIAERKNYWQSSRNFVKCTGSQIKQPETGSSELKPRFATSSKNHAANNGPFHQQLEKELAKISRSSLHIAFCQWYIGLDDSFASVTNYR